MKPAPKRSATELQSEFAMNCVLERPTEVVTMPGGPDIEAVELRSDVYVVCVMS
jgi:hypothetical protein